MSALLLDKQIENFLPLQKKLQQWKDRKKWVDFPVMPGYIFVFVNSKELSHVAKTENVVSFITFEGKPAVVRQNDIEALKVLLKQPEELEVTRENFIKGKQVEILSGPLTGLIGELTEIRGKQKFLIRLNQLNTSFYIEISDAQLKLVE